MSTKASVTPVSDGITAAAGFQTAGVHCGIKAKPGALDLAVIVADGRASMAGLFTTNLAQAAPVLVSKRHLEQSAGTGRAVVVNSGCANACTGTQGMADADAMANQLAGLVGCAPAEVLVASTGVIGVNLKMDKVRAGIEQAFGALSTSAAADAAPPASTHPSNAATSAGATSGSSGSVSR